jgi:hypothetical protein
MDARKSDSSTSAPLLSALSWQENLPKRIELLDAAATG